MKLRSFRRSIPAELILLLIVLWTTGCNDSSRVPALSESEERHFQRGQQMLRENRRDEALAAFLRVIDSRQDAPESHLEAGRLYHEHIGDPIAAIYHYRKYLEARPNSEQAKIVRQLIESAQKDFARTLPGEPFKDPVDRLDLLEIIRELRAENAALKAQIAELRQRGGASVAVLPQQQPPQQPAAQQPPAAQPTAPMRTYTVREGDTLSRISTTVYGTSARWADIYQANRDILPNPNRRRVGQELRIP